MDVEEQEISSSFVDERNPDGIVPLNLPPQIEPDVYPNQRDLAMELLARLEFLLQKQEKTWEDFDIFDFQVRKEKHFKSKPFLNKLFSDLHSKQSYAL